MTYLKVTLPYSNKGHSKGRTGNSGTLSRAPLSKKKKKILSQFLEALGLVYCRNSKRMSQMGGPVSAFIPDVKVRVCFGLREVAMP